jgi:DNA-binding MarR family transcriptional regulator
MRKATTAAAKEQPAGIIHLDTHIPTLVSILANRLRRAASHHYRTRYGIGIVEWRMVMFLGDHPNATANQISKATDLDKGAVSRSLRVLKRKGWITMTRVHASSRHGAIALSEKGLRQYEVIAEDAERRHRRLIAGLDREKVDVLRSLLWDLVERIPQWKFDTVRDAR